MFLIPKKPQLGRQCKKILHVMGRWIRNKKRQQIFVPCGLSFWLAEVCCLTILHFWCGRSNRWVTHLSQHHDVAFNPRSDGRVACGNGVVTSIEGGEETEVLWRTGRSSASEEIPIKKKTITTGHFFRSLVTVLLSAYLAE
jgi:hypothetical protein